MHVQFKDGEMCPFCESETIVRRISSEVYTYKDAKITIEGVASYRCERCEEEFVVPGENKEVDRQLAEFYAEADGILTPKEIQKARKCLGFTQERFAAQLGVGKKNFAKYESGSMRPSMAMSHLIRILYNQPNVLRYVHSGRLDEAVDIGQ